MIYQTVIIPIDGGRLTGRSCGWGWGYRQLDWIDGQAQEPKDSLIQISEEGCKNERPQVEDDEDAGEGEHEPSKMVVSCSVSTTPQLHPDSTSTLLLPTTVQVQQIAIWLLDQANGWSVCHLPRFTSQCSIYVPPDGIRISAR